MNTSDLLSKVKLKGALPEGRFEDDELLEMAYDALLSEVVPLIVSMREEYYVKSETSTVASSTAIPGRALGLALREVKLLRNDKIVDLPRINLEEVTDTREGNPECFYLENNSVVLYPAPQTLTDTLKLSFFFRPNKLVAVEEAGAITGIDRVTGVITVTPPSGWTTANTFDFVSSLQGHDVMGWDVAASGLDASTITVDPDNIPASLRVGDYICLAGESPYAQIPDEAFNLLSQLTICDCLEEMGSLQELQAATAKVEKLKASLATILSTRVQGAPKRFRTSLI